MCCRCSAASRAAEKVWESGLWMLRGKHLVLIPGDSPIGLRLPVASLPWVAAAEYPYLHPPDPFAPASRAAGAASEFSRSGRRRASTRSARTSTEPDERVRRCAIACRRWANRRLGSCGRRCASSRATADCTSSCRR